MYQRLLVPVDASPCSEVASSLAMRLARAFGSHVTLMHALSRDDASSRLTATRLLERLSNGARHAPKLILEPPTSDVAECIVSVAQREASDMILIGTHAHARLERKALGSVAHDVAVLAQVPVLMVPAHIRKGGLEGRWLQATNSSAFTEGA
jgi:nucleotide-binding universal stress UspA family protein